MQQQPKEREKEKKKSSDTHRSEEKGHRCCLRLSPLLVSISSMLAFYSSRNPDRIPARHSWARYQILMMSTAFPECFAGSLNHMPSEPSRCLSSETFPSRESEKPEKDLKIPGPRRGVESNGVTTPTVFDTVGLGISGFLLLHGLGCL